MIFVTGGTGLIGSHLLVKLSQKHDAITAIYRNQSKIETVKQCFDYYLKDQAEKYFQKITWKECDILDVPLLDDCMQGHTEVYHCAGFVSFDRRDFNDLIQINRYGTKNMVNVALSLGVEKFCYVSSTIAVGNKDIPESVEITEDEKWVKTDDTPGYSISKYSAENEVWRGMEEGLNIVIVNPSVVIGAGNWKESSLAIFDSVEKGMPFYPPGANAYVDARDVVNIMTSLMEKNIFNERYICVGENAKFKTFLDLIAKGLGKKPPSIALKPFMMQLGYYLSSIGKVLVFSRSKITKSLTKSSFGVAKFSNQKIVDTLGYKFYSLEESVDNAIKGRIKV